MLSAAEINETAAKMRLPVYRGAPDQLVGIIEDTISCLVQMVAAHLRYGSPDQTLDITYSRAFLARLVSEASSMSAARAGTVNPAFLYAAEQISALEAINLDSFYKKILPLWADLQRAAVPPRSN